MSFTEIEKDREGTVLLFSGTTEGRELSEYLSLMGIETKVFVATGYGAEAAGELEHISVLAGRLSETEIEEEVKQAAIVIDATHPYAVKITESIREAADKYGVLLYRCLREEAAHLFNDYEGVFGSVREAAAYLCGTEGRIFISTGAKELQEYAVIPDFTDRVVSRLLPAPESVKKAEELKLRHVVYGKGPFSYEENREQFKRYDVKYLVTKDGGIKGGFNEKLLAARELGIKILLIRRPGEAEGFSVEEIKQRLSSKFV